MRYWLIKSEPFKFSWDQFVKAGRTHWDGVRNHQAAANLRAMKNGDRAFFYHSNEGKDIVGIAEIVKEAYPDPSDETGKFVMVDVKAAQALKRPVTLAQIKAHPLLQSMALVKQSRLSVGPVSADEYKIICALGEV